MNVCRIYVHCIIFVLIYQSLLLIVTILYWCVKYIRMGRVIRSAVITLPYLLLFHLILHCCDCDWVMVAVVIVVMVMVMMFGLILIKVMIWVFLAYLLDNDNHPFVQYTVRSWCMFAWHIGITISITSLQQLGHSYIKCAATCLLGWCLSRFRIEHICVWSDALLMLSVIKSCIASFKAHFWQ